MDLKEIMDGFPNKKIAVIGDVMLDCHIDGLVERISPEAPVPVVNVEREVYSLGGAANVARNIHSLGGQAFLFGYVGQDLAKEELIQKIKSDGFFSFLQDEFSKTIQKTRVMGNGHQIARIDIENGNSVSEESEKNLIARLSEVNPDLIVVSDYAKGTITQTLFSKLIRLGKKVIVDPKPKNKIDYSGAYLITPNLNEGIEFSGSSEIEHIGNYLQQKYGSKILLTLGPKGMALFEGGEILNIPTQAKEIYDVTGAGDSVIATVGLGIASGLNLKQAAILANQVAGIVVEREGTATVSLNELDQLVRAEDAKIKTLDELKKIREDCRRRGEKFIWTNGCFDLLHSGHVDYLRKTKRLGDYLAVGLNSDSSVQQLKPGKGRPIIPERERAEVLSALGCVDGVVIFPELRVCNCLEALKPDLFVKAGDYSVEKMDQDERRIVESYGGGFEFIPITRKTSTSEIIDKIKTYDL
jgi:D-beta-D-heptose 7-phosphate kinase / D-beta-D-heptose 1-phosphate adenosyltransferase